jgi:site-specific DNA recombinase
MAPRAPITFNSLGESVRRDFRCGSLAAAAADGDPCENAGWIDGQAIEARVLAGLKEKLLAPSLVAAFVEEFERELKVAQRQAAGTAKELRAQLHACERQIANIVDVVTEGRSNPALLKRLDQLEAELAGLKGQLASACSAPCIWRTQSAQICKTRRL